MVATMTLHVGDAADSAPDQEVNDQPSGWSFSDSLLTGPEVSFSTAGQSAAGLILSELASDVWVNVNGELVARCRVTDMPQRWSVDGGSMLEVKAVGYRRLLAFRHLLAPVSYTDVAQSAIVWDMVQQAQNRPNGALGITAGYLEPGVPRTRTEWVVHDSIGERLDQFRDIIDGPIWQIDGHLKLHVRRQSSFDVHPMPIVFGTNARTMTRRGGAATFANSVIGSGDGQSTTPVRKDSALVAAGADPRGRWERRFAWPTVIQQTTLDEHTLGALTSAMTPAAVWSVTIDPARYATDSDYRVGDLVTVSIPADAALDTPERDTDCQVTGVSLKYDDRGALTISLDLLEVDDGTGV